MNRTSIVGNIQDCFVVFLLRNNTIIMLTSIKYSDSLKNYSKGPLCFAATFHIDIEYLLQKVIHKFTVTIEILMAIACLI